MAFGAWVSYVDVFINKAKTIFSGFVPDKYNTGLHTTDFVNDLKNLPPPTVDPVAQDFYTAFEKRFKDLATLAKSNGLIDDTRAQLKTNLKAFAITDEKKGEIYANFEAAITATMASKVFDVAMQIPSENAKLKGLEIENLQKQAALMLSEAELQAKHKQLEILNAELQLKASEELIKAGEKEIQDKNIALLDEQIANEKYRTRDIQASVLVKNYQALAAWMSARFEHIRRKVLLKSDEGNLQIKKADAATNFMTAITNRIDPTTEDINYVKQQISDITDATTKIEDDSANEVGAKPGLVSLEPRCETPCA